MNNPGHLPYIIDGRRQGSIFELAKMLALPLTVDVSLNND